MASSHDAAAPFLGSDGDAHTGVYVARHGQTTYNAQGRFQGRLPVTLDDTGREQARQLAQAAAPLHFAVLWSSTLERARETAAIVSERIGLPVHEDDRLVETDTGDWTDRWMADMRGQAPDQMAAFVRGDADFAFPGGESFAQQGRRVAQALHEIERGPLPALVICHGMVIRVALSLRRPEGFDGQLHGPIPNATLIELPPDHGPGGDAA